MIKITKNQLIPLSLGVLIFSLLIVIYIFAAWTEPPQAPPGGNVSAPLTECPSGWWSAAYGRVCMEQTERGIANMWNAIGACKGLGNGARVCTHNDFQQICGTGVDPYGASSGWYGDHGDNPNEGANNSDDDYLIWNMNYCANNNDGSARGADAVSLNYHCCI